MPPRPVAPFAALPSASRTLNSGAVEVYSVDLGDKLTSIAVGGNTVKSFGHDAAGRRTSMTELGIGTTTYTWDSESRITAVNRGGAYPIATTNAYNGLDTRVSKMDSTGSNYYKRDGASVTSPLLADVGTTYTPGISEKRDGTWRYLHSGLKNADSRTLADKSVEATRDYDAFGNLIGSTGTWNGPFGYAGGFGYQEDPDHGLKLLGHRYYDSTTGRFLSRDPAEDGRNWFAYCANMPTRSADPSGGVQVDLIWRPVETVYLPNPGSRHARPVAITFYHVALVITDNRSGSKEPMYTFGGGLRDGKCGTISGPWAAGVNDYEAVTRAYGRYSKGKVPAIRLVDDDTPVGPMLAKISAWDMAIDGLGFPYFPTPGTDNVANSGSYCHELVIRNGWEDEYDRAIKKRRKAGHADEIAPGWSHRPPTFRSLSLPK